VARIRRSKVGREKEDKIFLLQRRQRHEGGKIVNFQNITNCLAKETKLVVQYIGLGYGSGRVLGVFRIRSARGILVSETRLHWTVPAGSQDLRGVASGILRVCVGRGGFLLLLFACVCCVSSLPLSSSCVSPPLFSSCKSPSLKSSVSQILYCDGMRIERV
jgi:hypothetical protein